MGPPDEQPAGRGGASAVNSATRSAVRGVEQLPAALADGCERCCCGGWCTRWAPTDEQRAYWPPRHSDLRDYAPPQLDEVYRLYQPVTVPGRWTEGLLEMWFSKNKPVKRAVHVPCWDSFRWNPLRWRGIVLGRTPAECLWSGTRQMRWARAVYAANLGREYVMPVRNVGRHGFKSDIKALCWMYCLMSCICSCGIGQLFSLCGGSLCMNFGACYSCHARERLRRRYRLPPTCGLPPGIDDCLVHFFCMYCAAHQELRELAARGVDGPGMHILDVLPDSFAGAPGIEEAKAARRKRLEGMLARPPKFFRARGRPDQAQCKTAAEQWRVRVADQACALEEALDFEQRGAGGGAPNLPISLQDEEAGPASFASSASVSPSSSSSGLAELGWCRYCAPQQQMMDRGLGRPLGSIGPAAVAQQRSAQLPSIGSGGAWQGGGGGGGDGGDGGGGTGAMGRPAGGGTGGGGPPPLFRHSVHHIPVVQEEPPPEALLRKAWSVAY